MPKVSSLLQQVAKRDNAPANTRAKIALRNTVRAALGGPAACRVFDAFAGEGHMHREVWSACADYVGCDRRFFLHGPYAFAADNRLVLRTIDLQRFNLFDLDAYGSPWEQVYIITQRRRVAPGELIGFVLTEGQGMKLKMGGMSHALAFMAGMKPSMPGMGSAQELAMDRAITKMGRLMGCDLIHRSQAVGKVGSSMYYIALVFRGQQP